MKNMVENFSRDGGNSGTTARSHSIEQSVECALSKDCPADFDIAEMEGSVLLKQAEEDVKKDESFALALNFSARQKKPIKHVAMIFDMPGSLAQKTQN